MGWIGLSSNIVTVEGAHQLSVYFPFVPCQYWARTASHPSPDETFILCLHLPQLAPHKDNLKYFSVSPTGKIFSPVWSDDSNYQP